MSAPEDDPPGRKPSVPATNTAALPESLSPSIGQGLNSPFALEASSPGLESPKQDALNKGHSVYETPPPATNNALHRKQSYSRLPRRISQLSPSGQNSGATLSFSNHASLSSHPSSPTQPGSPTSFQGSGESELERIKRENEELRASLASSKTYIDTLESSLRTITASPARPGTLNAEPNGFLRHSKPMYDLKQRISGDTLRQAYRDHEERTSKPEHSKGSVLGPDNNGENDQDSGHEDSVNGSPARDSVKDRYGGLGLRPASMNGLDRVAPAETERQSPAKMELNRIPISHVQSSIAVHSVPQAVAVPNDTSTTPQSPDPSASPGGLRLPLQRARVVSTSSRVIEELSRENEALRNNSDKVRKELLQQKRIVAQLHTQNEDLKATRERMRAESDSLNTVISRKERLLQEVLDRARTAESSLAAHLKERKASDQTTKKQLTEMTNRLAEAELLSSRSEREALSLRESVKSLKESWKREVKALRAETKANLESNRKEREDARTKHMELTKLLQSQSASIQTISELRKESEALNRQVMDSLGPQIVEIKDTLESDVNHINTSNQTAQALLEELDRLKRLMRAPLASA